MAINQTFNANQPSTFERLLGAVQGVTGTLKGIEDLKSNAMARKLAEDASRADSEVSKGARDFISTQTGITIPENTSANMLKDFATYVSAKNDREFQRSLRQMELDAKQKSGELLTPGQKAADVSFGKDASDYVYQGGRATVDKNINKLQSAIDTLTKNKGLTGGFFTQAASLGGDKLLDVTSPQLAQVRDDIRGAIQGTLRQVMGPQFTEKEGTAMFERAFNPRLSAEENVRRATQELNALQAMVGAKEEAMNYYNKNGTLAGFVPQGPKEAQAPDEHAQARAWALANPNDPRAAEILKKQQGMAGR